MNNIAGYLIDKAKVVLKTFFVKQLVYKISLRLILRILMFKINWINILFLTKKKVQYFFHSYNNFRLTERCIEIPKIKYYLNNFLTIMF